MFENLECVTFSQRRLRKMMSTLQRPSSVGRTVGPALDVRRRSDGRTILHWCAKIKWRGGRRHGSGGGSGPRRCGGCMPRPRRHRLRLGGGTKTKIKKNSENEKIAKKHRKNREKIYKNIDFGGATKKRTSPSNSTRKATPIDLFSSPYEKKWPKTCYWTSANGV